MNLPALIKEFEEKFPFSLPQREFVSRAYQAGALEMAERLKSGTEELSFYRIIGEKTSNREKYAPMHERFNEVFGICREAVLSKIQEIKNSYKTP